MYTTLCLCINATICLIICIHTPLCVSIPLCAHEAHVCNISHSSCFYALSCVSHGTLVVRTHDEVHVKVLLAAEAAVEIDAILDRHMGWKVEEPDATFLVDQAFTYGATMNSLCKYMNTPAGGHKKLFKVTTKMHDVCHMAMVAKYLHPRHGACYIHEDFMQVVRRFAQSAAHGSSPAMQQQKTVEQWAVAKHLNLTSQSEWYR